MRLQCCARQTVHRHGLPPGANLKFYGVTMTTEERLEKMEYALAETKTALRRTRQMLGVGALLVLGVLSVAAMKVDPVIRAKAFIVTDEQGHDRAVFGEKQGVPGIVLFDQRGGTRVDMEVDRSGPYLRLIDERGKIRTSMVSLPSGGAVTVSDATGRVRVGLGDLNQNPNLSLMNDKGKVVWTTPRQARMGAGTAKATGKATGKAKTKS